jgi:cellulose synthase/poly-beta-1,6-N-acetylglucosamine synthase-like glycosyltransferase
MLGEVLIRRRLISAEQLAKALELQSHWGSRLGDVILSTGWVRPCEFYRALADHYGLDFVDLIEKPADAPLADPARYLEYSESLYLPWRRDGDILWIATADPSSPALREARLAHPETRVVMTSKFDIIWELQHVAEQSFSHDAVFELSERDPKHSARVVATRAQKFAFAMLAAIFLSLLCLFPKAVAICTNAVTSLFLFSSFLFRTLLCWMSYSKRPDDDVPEEELAALQDSELPVYTILVPMYQEPDVLPILAAALRRMDYPRSKLDIKLVLEAGDDATIQAAKELALDATFEIIRVPPSLPRTKPKACNYALHFARGKYLTIYDAEDQPEPDQLKKVVAMFRKLDKDVACVQARLNYFNAEENWLTRMFTLEYSLLFDMFLPALGRLGIPIPLGGTSNHFDLQRLRAVGAWDPFNVTEDADLGLRFAALGYKVAVVNSVTYEEANSQLGNWIRQRSRWIKGYIQTWLVNMREPISLTQRVGLRGFCSLQLFIGGGVFSALVYPFLFLPFLLWLFARNTALTLFFPPPVLLLSVLNLVAGNGCLICLSMLAAKRRQSALVPYALTIPAYWALMPIAGYKGLWQLMTRPFYWEKTTHGISKFTSSEVQRASSQAA